LLPFALSGAAPEASRSAEAAGRGEVEGQDPVASTATADAAAEPATTTAWITGVVRDRAGAPLAGAVATNEWPVEARLSNDPLPAANDEAATGADGRFELEVQAGPESRRTAIVARAAGYRPGASA